MKPIVLVPIALGVAALLAFTAKPTTKQGSTKPAFWGLPLSPSERQAYYSAANLWLSGKAGAEKAAATIDKYNAKIVQGFGMRRGSLPADANPSHIDSYGHEGVWLYRWGVQGITNSHTVTVVDEYGRLVAGVGNDFGAALLSTAQAILPYVPGIGSAASAALATAIAIGQGKSLKDAALAGARAALPGPAQMAFDLGVAVASGEPIDTAAKNALVKQIPGGPAAYEQGKAVAKQVGVTK